MRLRRNNLLVEPPTSATGDIAFNLIVFFLVCASVQPDTGRRQSIPSTETVEEESQQTETVEVLLTRTGASINGDPVRPEQFLPRLRSLLTGRARPEDRIVVVKSRPDTPYHHWIRVTTEIDEAGGIVTLQLEEEREVRLPD